MIHGLLKALQLAGVKLLWGTMLSAPACERNKAYILDVLSQYVKKEKVSSVLELASGTGIHVTYFAQNLPDISFQPSEVDSKCLNSIKAYRDHLNVSYNVREPLLIDLSRPDSFETGETFDMMFASNFTHISPFECSIGAFKIADKALKSSKCFLIYGPFSVDGVISPESNQNFDRSLRSQNSSWGYRDTTELSAVAADCNFSLESKVAMPSNNWILVFRKV